MLCTSKTPQKCCLRDSADLCLCSKGRSHAGHEKLPQHCSLHGILLVGPKVKARACERQAVPEMLLGCALTCSSSTYPAVQG